MEKRGFLYCYKMTHDTGFAPNPYHRVLTLATCKPVIRRCAKENCWISGWTSNEVVDKNGEKQLFTDNNQKLIYLAKISKVIGFKEYWESYPEKRQPDHPMEGGKGCLKSCGNTMLTNNVGIDFCGDNIYEPNDKETFGFKQHENPHHGEQNKEHDLSGKNVLVCEEYYYFGVENAIEIKNKSFIVHRNKKMSLETKEAKDVIEYVTKTFSKGLYPKIK